MVSVAACGLQERAELAKIMVRTDNCKAKVGSSPPSTSASLEMFREAVFELLGAGSQERWAKETWPRCGWH